MLTSQELAILANKNEHFYNKYFLGIYPLNRLPLFPKYTPLGLIVNTDTANLPGTHWIAVVVLADNRGEVFDSFGEPTPPRLQLWMNKHCSRGWISNKHFIQGPLTTICGAYCLYYLYHRLVLKHSMNDIQKQLLTCKNADTYVLYHIEKFFL